MKCADWLDIFPAATRLAAETQRAPAVKEVATIAAAVKEYKTIEIAGTEFVEDWMQHWDSLQYRWHYFPGQKRKEYLHD